MLWLIDDCCNIVCVCACVFQSCEVMAAASVSRPGGPQTIEKSQLILKGNFPPISITVSPLCFRQDFNSSKKKKCFGHANKMAIPTLLY